MVFNRELWAARRRKNKARMQHALNSMLQDEHVHAYNTRRLMQMLVPQRVRLWMR